MNEPNYSVDPVFDSEEEWLSCCECQEDFIRYDKHCDTCQPCVQKELEDNEKREKEAENMNDAISWGELAELTHATQVERFGWCICEDPEQGQLAEDCPQREEENK